MVSIEIDSQATAGRHREAGVPIAQRLRSALGNVTTSITTLMQSTEVTPSDDEIAMFQAAAAVPGAFEPGGSLYNDGCNTEYVERAQYVLGMHGPEA